MSRIPSLEGGPLMASTEFGEVAEQSVLNGVDRVFLGTCSFTRLPTIC